MNNRKGGMIARIRVNTKDCLAIMDTMEALGLNPYQHSFSGCVSTVLSSLIAVARRANLIPQEEDGFRYLEKIGPFMDQQEDVNTRIKKERINQLYEKVQGGLEPLSIQQGGTGESFQTPMEEYLVLKEKVLAGQLDPSNPLFLELQRILF